MKIVLVLVLVWTLPLLSVEVSTTLEYSTMLGLRLFVDVVAVLLEVLVLETGLGVVDGSLVLGAVVAGWIVTGFVEVVDGFMVNVEEDARAVLLVELDRGVLAAVVDVLDVLETLLVEDDLLALLLDAPITGFSSCTS